jgi:hypothetical protein
MNGILVKVKELCPWFITHSPRKIASAFITKTSDTKNGGRIESAMRQRSGIYISINWGGQRGVNGELAIHKPNEMQIAIVLPPGLARLPKS